MLPSFHSRFETCCQCKHFRETYQATSVFSWTACDSKEELSCLPFHGSLYCPESKSEGNRNPKIWVQFERPPYILGNLQRLFEINLEKDFPVQNAYNGPIIDKVPQVGLWFLYYQELQALSHIRCFNFLIELHSNETAVTDGADWRLKIFILAWRPLDLWHRDVQDLSDPKFYSSLLIEVIPVEDYLVDLSLIHGPRDY